MATPKENFVQKVLRVKKSAEAGLQAVGGQISANEAQGKKDFESGAIPYNAAINPVKGARAAFTKAYRGQ